MKAIALSLLTLLPLVARAGHYETPYCRTLVWAVGNDGKYIVAEAGLSGDESRRYFRQSDVEIGATFTKPSFPGNGKNIRGINAMVKVGGKMLMYAVARGSESGRNILSLSLGADPEDKAPNTCFGRLQEVTIDCTNHANRRRLDHRIELLLKDEGLAHAIPDCR